MRLLFDQNLSPHLARRLVTEFPGSLHVRDLGLADATDRRAWDRAVLDGLTIVTKDADYQVILRSAAALDLDPARGLHDR